MRLCSARTNGLDAIALPHPTPAWKGHFQSVHSATSCLKPGLGQTRFHGVGANIISALLGTVTPFCSCSSIPLFIGTQHSLDPAFWNPVVNDRANANAYQNIREHFLECRNALFFGQQEKGRNKILLLWRQLHPGGDETGRSGKGSFRG